MELPPPDTTPWAPPSDYLLGVIAILVLMKMAYHDDSDEDGAVPADEHVQATPPPRPRHTAGPAHKRTTFCSRSIRWPVLPHPGEPSPGSGPGTRWC